MMPRSLAVAIRTAFPLLLAIFLLAGVCLGGVLAIHLLMGVPVGVLTRDTSAVTRAPLYTGILSNIGIVLWTAACAICLLSARVLAATPDSKIISRFFYASALYTALLLGDDLFQLHEAVFPKIGLPQDLVYGAYVVAGFVWLVYFRRIILTLKYPILGVALFFFALSIMMDFFKFPTIKHNLFEDGAKFTGIVSWLVFFVDAASFQLLNSQSRAVISAPELHTVESGNVFARRSAQ